MNIIPLLHHSWSTQNQFNGGAPLLPHPPFYHLPESKWYFCDRNLATLRKRRQHTGLGRFIEGSQKGVIIVIISAEGYMQSIAKHVLQTAIAKNQEKSMQIETIQQCTTCKSSMSLPVSLIIDPHEFPSLPTEHPSDNQILKQLLHSRGIEPSKTAQIGLYRLNVEVAQENIGWVNWNQQSTQFQGGIKLNQHMSKKLVQSCELFALRIEAQMHQILKHMHLEPCLRQINSNARIFAPSHFKLWYFKNSINNEAYILSVTDVRLVGMSSKCQPLFQGIRLGGTLANAESKSILKLKQIQKESNIDQIRRQYKSLKRNSLHTVKIQERADVMQRMKEIADKFNQINVIAPLCPDQNGAQQAQSMPQHCSLCSSCHGLICGVAKLLAMLHIPKVQYLRGVKMIKKIVWNQKYDLVGVCDQCYQAYLKEVKIHLDNVSKQNEHKPKVINQQQAGTGLKNKFSREKKRNISLHAYNTDSNLLESELDSSIHKIQTELNIYSKHPYLARTNEKGACKQISRVRTTTNHSSAKTMAPHHQTAFIDDKTRLRISTQENGQSANRRVREQRQLLRDHSEGGRQSHQIGIIKIKANTDKMKGNSHDRELLSKNLSNDTSNILYRKVAFPFTIRQELQSKGVTPNHRKANSIAQQGISHPQTSYIMGAVNEYELLQKREDWRRKPAKIKSYIDRKFILEALKKKENTEQKR